MMTMLQLAKDKVLMSTTLFASKNALAKDTTMENEIESKEARQEFIKSFADGFYTETGKARAEEIVTRINRGILFNDNPVIFMDSIADQDNLMLSVAAFLAENKDIKLRQDYLSNKFIIQLNKADEYMGLPKYVTTISEDKLTPDRRVVFDDPDYSQVDEELATILKADRERMIEVEKAQAERIEQINKEVDEYNAQLKEKIEKELEEERQKKAEKEAKKAEKQAQKEAKKAAKEEEKKAKAEEKEAKKAEKGAKVFQLSRSRAAVTKGNNSTASTNTSSASTPDAGNGGSGKSEDSSDSGDPDPASHSKINMYEVLPLEKACPILFIDDEDEKKKILDKAEEERRAFVAAMSGDRNNETKSEAEKKVQAIADTLAKGDIPPEEDVDSAIATVTNELNQIKANQAPKRTVQYETGRFTQKEINGRSDLQLIQDTLTEAVSTVAGVEVDTQPSLNGVPDEYSVTIKQNGLPVDTFNAYGSRILGKGCPVLDGFVDTTGTGRLVPYFVPIHSLTAVRQIIFRRVQIQNINGETISGPQGVTVPLANGLMMTICKDYNLLDHVDLSNHAFENDAEAHNFFHVLAAVLNKVSENAGIDGLLLPRYRVANYRAYNKFDLFGDQPTFDSKPMFRADTSVYGKASPENIGPDGRRIQVTGKNLVITERDGNKVQTVINY